VKKRWTSISSFNFRTQYPPPLTLFITPCEAGQKGSSFVRAAEQEVSHREEAKLGRSWRHKKKLLLMLYGIVLLFVEKPVGGHQTKCSRAKKEFFQSPQGLDIFPYCSIQALVPSLTFFALPKGVAYASVRKRTQAYASVRKRMQGIGKK
jgi:hypothetical protein